ncbi:MAG: carboxypeptidase-like regulatory domain-containing protein [Candidatus Acidiferrales bacterium]
MKRLVLVVIAAVLLAFAATADDKGGLGTLAGTVVGANGAPIVGARVTSEQADGTHPHATTTNKQGRFFFADLVHGYYEVRAYHDGAWSDWKHNVEVNTGKQTEVTLRVPAKKKKSS